MMECSERVPMFPVVHWITRSGRSVVVVMCASSVRRCSRHRLEYVYARVRSTRRETVLLA
jgi:hypothetical protein